MKSNLEAQVNEIQNQKSIQIQLRNAAQAKMNELRDQLKVSMGAEFLAVHKQILQQIKIRSQADRMVDKLHDQEKSLRFELERVGEDLHTVVTAHSKSQDRLRAQQNALIN